MALNITSSILTPTSLLFVDDGGVSFNMKVLRLDENNDWEVIYISNVQDSQMEYHIQQDGVYRIDLNEVLGEDIEMFIYVCYEQVKSKLRKYIKQILCNCCEDNCRPCDNRHIYDFTMLTHLSLPYLGNNKYLLISPDISNEVVRLELESINNAIVRTQRYILNYDI